MRPRIAALLQKHRLSFADGETSDRFSVTDRGRLQRCNAAVTQSRRGADGRLGFSLARSLSPFYGSKCKVAEVHSRVVKPTLPAAFQAYLAAPPPGSALARAIAYGIDPTLTLFNMYGLTREERLARAGATVRSAAEIAQSRVDRL